METETAAKVATYLLQINAIKLDSQKPFTWASGLRSPIY
jgi:orotate phosphoribosyltransferase